MAWPVEILTIPDAPLLVVPDANDKPPLTPDVPAFTVRTAIDPLVVGVLKPDDNDKAPPLDAVLVPAVTEISPPTPAVPDPTLMRISPPLPPVAAPLATLIDPLEPELVVPEAKLNIPLVPAVPASVLLRTIIPLEVAVPSPVARLIAPPVNGSESPA